MTFKNMPARAVMEGDIIFFMWENTPRTFQVQHISIIDEDGISYIEFQYNENSYFAMPLDYEIAKIII